MFGILRIYHTPLAAGCSLGMDIIWQIQVCRKVFFFFLTQLKFQVKFPILSGWNSVSSSMEFISSLSLGLCLSYGILVSKHQGGLYCWVSYTHAGINAISGSSVSIEAGSCCIEFCLLLKVPLEPGFVWACHTPLVHIIQVSPYSTEIHQGVLNTIL